MRGLDGKTHPTDTASPTDTYFSGPPVLDPVPVVPNLLERLVLLRLNRGPGPALDLFATGSFEAATLALDLGVFEALAEEPLHAEALAERVDAHPAGVRALLDFLVATGYVEVADGRYRNTSMTARWLLESSDTDVGPWLRFWDELVFPFWEEHLEATVRTGEPPTTLYEYCDEAPERWELAQRGFRATATVLLDDVVDAVDVPPDATRLLDVGGGHGLYAVELCRRYPDLSATVFDDPAALGVAREEITGAGLEDRMAVEGGDYRRDDLGAGYDLALLFNVVHAHDAAENVALFESVAHALEPGGRIAVLDQLVGSSPTPLGETGLRFVGLTYLVTLGASIHDFESVEGWLHAAGFRAVERTSFRAAPGTVLVEATKA